MAEASRSTPLFFILFPGYSPSKDVEVFAASQERTVKNGKLTLISMGQVTPSCHQGLDQQLLDDWRSLHGQGAVKTVESCCACCFRHLALCQYGAAGRLLQHGGLALLNYQVVPCIRLGATGQPKAQGAQEIGLNIRSASVMDFLR